ncbi:MAG: hypothetical protein WC914_08665 [Proteiniphilum sp.]|jgi:hypothetical protein
METKFNKLKEADKRNPFTVPENYFAQFNKEIMDRLPEKEYVPPQTVSLWDRVKPWVYMAAMFAGLYITINFLTKDTETPLSSSQDTFSAISEETPANNYWSTVHVTEEEFYRYLEEQLVDDGYYDYMYNQLYLN